MKPSMLAIPAALALCLLALPACQSASVRGTGDKSLTATTPRSMTIHRGASEPLEIGIDRRNFDGPVTVSLFQLPRGVESDRASIDSQSTSATFILTAAAGADLVRNQAVGVTVADPNGRQVTQFFNLTVRE